MTPTESVPPPRRPGTRRWKWIVGALALLAVDQPTTTVGTPPRPPRGPRRWPWMLIVALIPVPYVGVYAALRATQQFRIVDSYVYRDIGLVRNAWISDDGSRPSRTLRGRIYWPCRKVEEWWLNW